MSTGKYVNLTGTSRATAYRELTQLAEHGLVKRAGQGYPLRTGASDSYLFFNGNCAPALRFYEGFALSLGYPTVDEGKRIFDALAAEGTTTMPFSQTFWAEGFGMCTDRFGTHWMVSGGEPK